MDRAAIYKIISQTVQACLPGCRIVLFGSRARDDNDAFSDYDLLIITPLTLTPAEKVKWSSRLDRAIVKAIKAPVDLVLNSDEEIEQKQKLPGHLMRSVLREGIRL